MLLGKSPGIESNGTSAWNDIADGNNYNITDYGAYNTMEPYIIP